MKRVIMYSGGVGSWATARRVIAEHGKRDVYLLFAETYMEDADLYRFVFESVLNLFGKQKYRESFNARIPEVWELDRKEVLDGLFRVLKVLVPQFHRVADGRNVWELFHDSHCIGNSKVDLCSSKLKRDLMDKWRNVNCNPDDTTIYVGIDWTEEHRLDRIHFYMFCQALEGKTYWWYEAPLVARPWPTKAELLSEMEIESIQPPELYRLGFAHNNCGGFCVKAGHSQFALLLRTKPDLYRWHEEQESRVRALQSSLGIVPSSVLYHRRGGKGRVRVTMKEFREEAERTPELTYSDDLARGCGCALDI